MPWRPAGRFPPPLLIVTHPLSPAQPIWSGPRFGHPPGDEDGGGTREEGRRDRGGLHGGGNRAGVLPGGPRGRDAGHRAAVRGRRVPPDPRPADEAGREGEDGEGGRGPRPREHPRDRQPQGGRGGRPARDRGDHREDGREEGAVLRARCPLPPGGRLRKQHFLSEHHGDGERDEARPPCDRDALLQPGPRDEADRGDPGVRDERRDRGVREGVLRPPGEGARRGEGVPGLRREPAPRPDDERGVQPPAGGSRERGGHRQGDEARDEHADGALRTRGLHGARHRTRRDGGPLPGDRGPEVPALPLAPEVRAGRPPRPQDGPRRVRLHEPTLRARHGGGAAGPPGSIGGVPGPGGGGAAGGCHGVGGPTGGYPAGATGRRRRITTAAITPTRTTRRIRAHATVGRPKMPVPSPGAAWRYEVSSIPPVSASFGSYAFCSTTFPAERDQYPFW